MCSATPSSPAGERPGSGSTGPASTDPGRTGRGRTDPSSTGPASTDPGRTGRGRTDLVSTDPGNTDPRNGLSPDEGRSAKGGARPLSDDKGPTTVARRPHSDLTARARIRDVAVELFASRGYRGTTIRDVAREAGVSPGLVQHHFGTKEGLREACDEHLAETLRAIMASQTPRSDWDRDLVAAMYDVAGPAMRYLARGLLGGWPGVSKVFDEGVLGTAQWLTESWPDRYEAESEKTRRHAAVMTTLSMGVVALHHHLGRWLGVDPLEHAHLHVTDSALVEIIPLMAEYLGTDEGLTMRTALAEYERDMESSEKKDDDE